MQEDFKIQIKVPMKGVWVPIDDLSDHRFLLDHYLSCDPSEIAAGGPWFVVKDRDWHDESFLDSFTNAACWFDATAKLVSGDGRVSVWAWEESNLYLERRGNMVTLEDAGHHGVIFPSLELPFEQFVRELFEQGKKLQSIRSELYLAIDQMAMNHSGQTHATESLKSLVKLQWDEIKDSFEGNGEEIRMFGENLLVIEDWLRGQRDV